MTRARTGLACLACLLALSAGCGGGGDDLKTKAIKADKLVCEVDDACLGDRDMQTADECKADIDAEAMAAVVDPIDPEACEECIDVSASAFRQFLDSDCDATMLDVAAVNAACDKDAAVDSDGDGDPDSDFDACE